MNHFIIEIMANLFTPVDLKLNRTLFITGSVPFDCDRFIVNLTTGSQPFPMYEIGLHLAFRFDTNTILMNSYSPNVGWRNQEVHSITLRKTDPFLIAISSRSRLQKRYYKIKINNMMSFKFKENPAVPIDQIKFMSITGHVNINKIS